MCDVGPADVLRRLGSLVLLGVCVCTVLSAGSLVLAHGAAADLRPDPPKLPQRPPPAAPPPPAASTTPAPDPAPAPPPAATPPPAPPPPAQVVPAAPKPAPAPPTASQQMKHASTTSAVRAASARARMRHVGMTRGSRAEKAVRSVAAVRPLPAAAYGVSSSNPRTGSLLVVLPLLAVGLLLLGAILVPAEVLPSPQPARVLVELHDEITFAGLGILAACAAVSILLLFVS
jgi:hypothetical protein